MTTKTKDTKEQKQKIISRRDNETIYEALFAFQDFDIRIAKNGTATGNNGQEYRYPLLDDILKEIKTPLQLCGLIYTQVITDGGLVTELISIDAKPEINKLTSTIELGSTSNPQEFGTRITYARKYGLLTILGLVGDDDTDASEVTKSIPVMKATPKIETKDTPSKEEQAVERGTDKDPEQPDTEKSEGYQKAWNAIKSCKNRDAMLLLSTRIEESTKLTDEEKKDLRRIIQEQPF